MAGAGYRVFSAGAVLTAAQVNTFLMEQSVMNFAGTAARGSALASVLSAGQMAHVGGGTVTVYDGSAWQQVYPSSPGLVFVAGTAFSSAATVSVNNCFSSTYQNYRIMVTSTGSVSNRPVMRLRVGGVDATTNYAGYILDGATNAATAQALAAQFFPMVSGTSTSSAFAVIDVFSPAEAVATGSLSLGVSAVTDVRFLGGRHTAGTAYDGFTLYGDSSGNITGNVRVYGYRNS